MRQNMCSCFCSSIQWPLEEKCAIAMAKPKRRTIWCQRCHKHRTRYPKLCNYCHRWVAPRCEPERCLELNGPTNIEMMCRDCADDRRCKYCRIIVWRNDFRVCKWCREGHRHRIFLNRVAKNPGMVVRLVLDEGY